MSNTTNDATNLLLGGDSSVNILEKLAENLKATVIKSALMMNDHAAKKDLPRNRVNYGVMIEAERVLRELNFNVCNATWADGEFLVCEELSINDRIVFKR